MIIWLIPGRLAGKRVLLSFYLSSLQGHGISHLHCSSHLYKFITNMTIDDHAPGRQHHTTAKSPDCWSHSLLIPAHPRLKRSTLVLTTCCTKLPCPSTAPKDLKSRVKACITKSGDPIGIPYNIGEARGRLFLAVC